jgi:hypothetical protein
MESIAECRSYLGYRTGSQVIPVLREAGCAKLKLEVKEKRMAF